jgi:opacity protein-like surface antigen
MPLLKTRAVVKSGDSMKIITLAVLLSILPTMIMTANADEAPYQHIIGINWGYGSTVLDTKHAKNEEGDMFIGEYHYRYMIQPNLGIEAGYKDAVNGIGTILVSSLNSVKDISFSGPRVSAYADYPFGDIFSIYAKAGLTYYELEYTYKTENQSQDYDKTSLGSEIAAGLSWGFKHIGFNIEYNYANSDTLELDAVMLGASVRF